MTDETMNGKAPRGFTLIELMITVAIVAILAAVAYPSYTEYVRKARRADARAALLATAQAMERFYTENMTYKGPTLSATSTIGKGTSPDGFYTIAFDSAPTGSSVCTGMAASNEATAAYRLCAKPTGNQASDKCGVLSLNQQGIRKPDTGGCW